MAKKTNQITPHPPISYATAKTKWKNEFNKKQNDHKNWDKQWPSNATFAPVIDKLQEPSPQFTSLDIPSLKDFVQKISAGNSGDTPSTHVYNWINNFANYPQLDGLFNMFVTATNYARLQKSLTSYTFTQGQQNSLPYLFSIVKNFQHPDKYPFMYKFWMNICDVYFSTTRGTFTDYDQLCDVYNNTIDIPVTDKPKHSFFAAYMDALGRELATTINTKGISNYSKKAITDVFNIDDYNSILNKQINQAHPVTTPPLHHPLNLILYGPPGTGKTYNTVNEALDRIQPTWKTDFENQKNNQNGITEIRDYALQLFNKYKEDGQIAFTTFHQSLSYEEFIEGIKPIPGTEDVVAIHNNATSPTPGATQFGEGTTTFENLKMMQYEVRPGIFKQLCEKAKNAAAGRQTVLNNPITPSILRSTIDDLLDKFSKNISTGGTYSTIVVTNKTYSLTIKRNKSGKLESFSFIKPNGRKGFSVKASTIKRDWNNFIDGNIKSANDILPTRQSKYKAIGTKDEHWALYNALKEFEKNLQASKTKTMGQEAEGVTETTSIIKQPYVLIIDEINRGNVSQIFGELITLIEEDKRLGNKEELTVKLPYSSSVDPDAEPFGVPNNLYIIGTMNTADRSVEALDTALRRRFEFKEMMPDSNLVKNRDIKVGSIKINLKELMDTINKRIRVLKDREHQIGHSYFMQCKDDVDLKNAFKNKIVPLLQEYFYGNYAYIGLVLGDEFVKIDNDATAVKFASFEFDETPEKDKKYRLLAENEWDGLNMEKALNKLMGEKEIKEEEEEQK